MHHVILSLAYSLSQLRGPGYGAEERERCWCLTNHLHFSLAATKDYCRRGLRVDPGMRGPSS